MESSVTHEQKMNFHINNFSIFSFDTYWGIKDIFFIKFKSNETHRSLLADRGRQVVVAELIPVTWPKTSHLIGSNHIFNHDHNRIVHTSKMVAFWTPTIVGLDKSMLTPGNML